MEPDLYRKSGFYVYCRFSTDGVFFINSLGRITYLHLRYEHLNFNKYGDASFAVHFCTLNEIIKILNIINVDY